MKVLFDTTSSKTNTVVSIVGNDLLPYIATVRSVVDGGTYIAPESSINLPSDETILAAVEELVSEKVSPALRYIFVVGIGGSNLGTKAIYDALRPQLQLTAELIFVDTNNASTIQAALLCIGAAKTIDEVLLVSISKSGGTSETLANTEILVEQLFLRWGRAVRSRLVVITDAGSAFAAAAADRDVSVLTMPTCVGGRFSVFSSVGLFPLVALGVPVRELLQGATEMRQLCVNPEVSFNYAAMSACLLYQSYQDGLMVHDTFVFQSELESVGRWYRQLLGESIGKEISGSIEGTRVGFVPTVSVGSTDLHSVGQLYLGGPKRTITSFVYSKNDLVDFTVPTERLFPTLAPMITGKTTSAIMDAILQGTIAAYKNQHLPHMEIVLDAIVPYELGALLQFKMIEVMYLGYLMGVNTFDQPGVELYKVETKRLLGGT